MSAAHEFQRLHWFSPAFPVGGYAYSHGIEMAVSAGDIRNGETLAGWIADLLEYGAGRNEAIMLAQAHHMCRHPDRETRLAELAELGSALAQSSERRLEALQQGASFFAIVHRAWPHPDLPPADAFPDLPLAIAVGIAGGAHGQPLVALIAAYLQAFAANLIAAGIRLSVIGQSEAQARLAALLPLIMRLAGEAESHTLDDLGGAVIAADLMSLRHETLETRLFRS